MKARKLIKFGNFWSGIELTSNLTRSSAGGEQNREEQDAEFHLHSDEFCSLNSDKKRRREPHRVPESRGRE